MMAILLLAVTPAMSLLPRWRSLTAELDSQPKLRDLHSQLAIMVTLTELAFQSQLELSPLGLRLLLLADILVLLAFTHR